MLHCKLLMEMSSHVRYCPILSLAIYFPFSQIPSASARLKPLQTLNTPGVKFYQFESESEAPEDLSVEEPPSSEDENMEEASVPHNTKLVRSSSTPRRKLNARRLYEKQLAQENKNKQEIHDLR